MSNDDATEERRAEHRRVAARLMAAILSNPGIYQRRDRKEPDESAKEEMRHAAKAAVYGADALIEELEERNGE